VANEQGIVVKVGLKEGNIALVKTIQHSACEACSSRSQCNPGDRGKESEVEAVNLVDAQVGDLIQISMDTRALLQATFFLYIFPIICLLIGAFIGNNLAVRMNMAPSLMSLSVGVACFAASMLLVRRRADHMALKLKYQPKITRILGRGSSAPSNGCGLQATSIQENLT
jgi:sigma-E factor negative regulatory protein RseC